jgi:uncharacterized membrane protein YphA (DoxX/SURF4 family)
MEIVEIVGKLLFSYLFITSGISHFRYFDETAAYARAKKLLFADLNVMISGAFLVVAPVLFVLGFFETIVLILMSLFLFLTAILFHDYWNQTDMQTKMNEELAFKKDISLLGAALIIIALI